MEKLNFLYNAISDTQGTIRAIDVKAGFMFVLMFFPVTGLESIFKVGFELVGHSFFYLYIIVPTILLWVISFYTLFKTVQSISDPSEHIEGDKPAGVFYSPMLFKQSLVDYFFNFPNKSEKRIEDYVESIPSDKNDIIKELAFEKMKLTYIRDIKIYRLSLCIQSSFGWVLLGCITWSLNLFHVGIS